jgi:hypothetical protein
MKTGTICISLLTIAVFSSCIHMPFKSVSISTRESHIDLFDTSVDARSLANQVFHYAKTNQDDSYRADVWIYYSSNTHSESFKIYPSTAMQGKTDLVIADYDLTKYQAAKVCAYLVDKNGNRTLNAKTEEIDDYIDEVSYKGTITRIDLGCIPSYNYNFDWCDFMTNYRYLRNKETNFSVGVTAPDSSIKFVYCGTADFEYVGNENTRNIDCRKYRIRGEAFADEKGYMYVDRETNTVTEINMPVRNTPSYRSFKLLLVEKSTMSESEWDEFIIMETRKVIF